MCRARYELDDAFEADVVCNGCHHRISSSDRKESESAALIDVTSEQGRQYYYTPPRHTTFLTLRLPNWIDFSYSTLRRHKPRHRHPNPFGPHRNSDLTVPAGTQDNRYGNPPNASLEREKLIASAAQPTGESVEDNNLARRPTHPPRRVSTQPVTPHPAPAQWDDQWLPDLPYDNPFYSRAIDVALWLPRNPLGLVDLDDTIDLTQSITVDQSAGRLGSWIGVDGRPFVEGLPNTPTSDVAPPGVGFSSTATHLPVYVQDIDGTEEIALPFIIAQRVQGGEKAVEHMPGPRKMSLRQRINPGDQTVRSTGRSTLRPSSIVGFLSPGSYRTSSSIAAQKHARSGSLMSTFQWSSTGYDEKGKSAELGSGFRPDAHAQADFVAATVSASQISLSSRIGLSSGTPTQTISTAQAIFRELSEEERRACDERLEEEGLEAVAELQKGKSWFSWLYWRSE